jgi:accessory colonization factor AcfC
LIVLIFEDSTNLLPFNVSQTQFSLKTLKQYHKRIALFAHPAGAQSSPFAATISSTVLTVWFRWLATVRQLGGAINILNESIRKMGLSVPP